MTFRVTAWQCIGCSKIEAPQPCIGVCHDRKVQFVYAGDHEAALAQLQAAHARAEVLRAFVSRIARTTPREGEWAHSGRAFQRQAREILGLGALPADET